MIRRGIVLAAMLLVPAAVGAQGTAGEWGMGNGDSTASPRIPTPKASAPTCFLAARTLARGVVLVGSDVTTGSHPRCPAPESRVPSLESRHSPSPIPHSPLGSITRRVIAAGEPLRPPAIEAPPLVAAGQDVEFIWSGENLSLTLRGTAATDAHRGERVWVRLGAGRRLQGTVTDRGRVVALSHGTES